jgi:hypothetical protein
MVQGQLFTFPFSFSFFCSEKDCLLGCSKEIQSGVSLLEKVVAVWELAKNFSGCGTGTAQEHSGR